MKKILIGLSLLILMGCGTVSKPYTFVNGQVADAGQVNSVVDTLYTVVNGNLENVNIKSGAGIVASKIAGGTFTAGTYSFNGSTISDLGTVSAATSITTSALIATTADINAGTVDATIGASTPAAGTFTTLNATGGGALTGTWTNLGSVTTVDINGGTVDGAAVGASTPAAGTFTTLNATGGGALTGTWTNLGSVTTVDVNGGTVDGTTVGASTPAAGTFTTLNATGGGALTGTWTNLGSVTTVDINGGTVDGTPIGSSSASSGVFTTVRANTSLNAPILVPGQVQNLSLTLSGTTLTIASGDGTALSATNPGWICLSSDVTPGTNITTSITANQTLDLNAIDGFEFGITAGTNWASAMPFFIKMARSDADAVAFFISRSPKSGAMPVADSIGDVGTDPVIDSQDAHIAFTDITPGDYDGNPVYTVGAFTAQYTGATTRWSVITLSTNDGFGQDKVDASCSTVYTFPAGQNGAVANYHINNETGANNPTWSTPANAIAYYTINRNGEVFYRYNTGQMGNCANGGVASSLRLFLPYLISVSGTNEYQYGFSIINNISSSIQVNISYGYYYALLDYNNFATINSLTANNFANANDDLYVTIRYKAF